MKNAQAKIDTLLDVLVEELQDRMLADAGPREAYFVELERLINLSNLNNKRKETIEKPSPQGKSSTMTDEELVNDLKAARDPDLFPRRGPRKGKRENPSVAYTPVPPVLESVKCAVHPDVDCVETPNQNSSAMWSCPECMKEPVAEFVSLKALL